MTGMTIDEICNELNLPFKTVEARIQRAGIKPITRQAVYPTETLDVVRNSRSVGRPPKKTAEQKKPVIKPKKLRK